MESEGHQSTTLKHIPSTFFKCYTRSCRIFKSLVRISKIYDWRDIYDLSEGTDFYVIEYDEALNLLIGIINPLKSRKSIKIKTYSVNNFKGHKLMYKYMENSSLLNILSNLESNEYFLLKQNIL